MDTGNKRRVCFSCSQDLAKIALFRHLHGATGTVCPGKRRRNNFEDDVSNTDSDREEHSISPRGLDSTLNLESCDGEVEAVSHSG